MIELKSMVIGLVLMINRFTCFNINLYTEIKDDDYQLGVLFLPVIGIVMGLVMFLISLLGLIYNKYFVSILILAFYFFITKGNTFNDITLTSNKFFLNTYKTDQNSNGIINIIIVLFYFTLFSIVPISVILITPIIGFSTLLLSGSITFETEYKHSIIKHSETKYRISAFIFSFLTSAIINYKLIIPVSFTFIFCGLFVNYINKNKPYLLENIEGFLIETSQIIFLILTYLLLFIYIR